MIEVSLHTLSNGLRVAHSLEPQSAMAVVDILYDTGARDESPDLTGIAHLFEHLMFGGSANVPSYDNALENAGGSSNASTGNDFTEFFALIPMQNIETAFFLESDRMASPDLSQHALDVQQHVVIEEFKQVCLNRPYGTMMHTMRPMLYPSHPYRWPVIGVEPDHIARVTVADARAWHSAHYSPDKAVLSVVGNIPAERVFEMAERWFGHIPPCHSQPRALVDDPWPTKLQIKTVYSSTPNPAVFMSYRMDPYGHRGYYAADAITDILSAGRSSRMYQRLMMGTDLFTLAQASITGSEHSGMLHIAAVLLDDSDQAIDRAISLLMAECEQLAIPGNVTPYELERTKNRYESTFVFDNVNIISRAQNVALAVMHGEDVNDSVPRYRSLTLDDISSTARRLFIDHKPAAVVFRPNKS